MERINCWKQRTLRDDLGAKKHCLLGEKFLNGSIKHRVGSAQGIDLGNEKCRMGAVKELRSSFFELKPTL